MRFFLFLLLWGGLAFQCLSAQIQRPEYTVTYPEFTDSGTDQIVYRTAVVTSQSPSTFVVNKTDWTTGDVFQFSTKGLLSGGRVHALSFRPNGEVVYLAQAATQTNQLVTLPSMHTGFVVDSAKEWRIGLVYDPSGSLTGPDIVKRFANENNNSSPSEKSGKSKPAIVVDQPHLEITYFIFSKFINGPKGETKLSVLCIGTQRPDLQYSEKDALDMAKAFKQWGERHYSEVNITTLVGNAASHTNILGTLEEFAAETSSTHQSDDRVILYFSGSGFVTDGERNLHLIASDYDYARPSAATVTYQDIYRLLSPTVGEKVLFIDAGIGVKQAGDRAASVVAPGSTSLLPIEDYTFYPVLSNQPEENSYENAAWENGAMTEALLEFLSENQASKKRKTMFSKMLFVVTGKTTKLARSIFNKPQHPMFSGERYLDFRWE